MRCGIYVRVSSDAQTVDNQLFELRGYVAGRQWTVAGEFRDEGISGSKDRRPALDRLMAEARRGSPRRHRRLVARPVRALPCPRRHNGARAA